MILQLRDNRGDRWRCTRRECRSEIALRTGTWLQGSKISYRDLILFIYCWSREMTSMKFVQHELELNHNTAIDFNIVRRKYIVWKHGPYIMVFYCSWELTWNSSGSRLEVHGVK